MQITETLGWQISLIDPRTGNARKTDLLGAKNIISGPLKGLDCVKWLNNIHVAILMNYNVSLDAQALTLVQNSSCKWVGLLGPVHRTDRVLSEANLTRSQLCNSLSNRMGLRLGGELPESIALSVVAEIHAYL